MVTRHTKLDRQKIGNLRQKTKLFGKFAVTAGLIAGYSYDER